MSHKEQDGGYTKNGSTATRHVYAALRTAVVGARSTINKGDDREARCGAWASVSHNGPAAAPRADCGAAPGGGGGGGGAGAARVAPGPAPPLASHWRMAPGPHVLRSFIQLTPDNDASSLSNT